MDQYAKIKDLIQPVLDKNKVKLYDVKWTSEKKNRVLQISILKDDGSMDIDTCALVSEGVSEVLDNEPSLNNAYFLEVCSPGAEREIKDLNELPNLINTHVYVRLKHAIKSMVEFTGDILEVNDEMITMNYRDKANTRKVSFNKDEIDYIRLAVKF